VRSFDDPAHRRPWSDLVIRLMARAFSLLLLVTLPGCQYLQDRVRECAHVQVDLVHLRLQGQPVNLVPEHEPYSNENLVYPGQTRSLTLCVERGDIKRFRVGLGQNTIAITNCAVSRATYEYEATGPLRVVFTDHDTLECQGW
jgi:hypothetical protein